MVLLLLVVVVSVRDDPEGCFMWLVRAGILSGNRGGGIVK
jgi:hypothetical protein